LYPANMEQESGAGNEPTRGQDDEATLGRGDTGEGGHYQALLAEAAGRVVRKEIAALTKAARRAGDDYEAFEREVREFYADHAGYVAQSLRMPLDVAEGYADTQMAAALRFGVSALTLDEAATVALLCELAVGEAEDV
jgi:hypothetical protein